ncbi:E3 ubiquitin-protein ligase RNF31 isoform X6 [Paralichthys olivaceus]|uniref:E3 ubiquitin-protein ligase RNF31 isoform X6 n=1 Tax=Paralichthys olivaceus TaxID=8255 RepID=UPI00097D0E8F|nr:PREDICTED: E3 ubiquitin-protein ligase RNF31-like isoform X5 [Paralichthys olivaceus]
MSRVKAEDELRTLLECKYVFPEQTVFDLQRVRTLYSDLRLYVDFYCFPNKEKKKLVYLAGTLPVHYEGSEYNIPVCIWLHETHPVSRPRCYVCPSVTMLINPSCRCVDASGNISLTELKNWTLPPPYLYPLLLHHILLPVSTESQWEQSREMRVRKSYTEELLGIDFSAPPSSNHSNLLLTSTFSGLPPEPLSRMMGALRLDESTSDQQSDSLEKIVQSEAARDRHGAGSGPPPGLHQYMCPQSQCEVAAGGGHIKMVDHLPPDQAAIFLSLMRMEGRNFRPSDVMEAVRLNRDLPSALRFLTHCCPICQDQVTFSKIITMTHCSCFLCQTCFKTFFSAAIKERSVDQLVCPQCGRPEVKGQGAMVESMEYFNLLDTQIRHFLSPQVHELFQRKLRDRALQEMKNFCWCSHCSFGILHEAERLRMDCPNCKKSTCSQCRSPWSRHHQGRSCDQFRLWQQQNKLDDTTMLSYNSIECPGCFCVFSLSRGGCLHFTCSQCQHQFCGGCSQTFSQGADCGFSVDCGTKGLHAHHPRDCLYHLRDWSVSRLHLLLQYYRVSPSWFEAANGSSSDDGLTGMCLVLELRDHGSLREEPCGRPNEYRGYCRLHYKEHLVELINCCGADPAVLFNVAEMTAELQRCQVAVPIRKPDELEPLYAHRLRLEATTLAAETSRRPPSSDLCCNDWTSAPSKHATALKVLCHHSNH